MNGYVNVGYGVCRINGDDSQGYGHWGKGYPSDDEAAESLCNSDSKCMAFWTHSSGSYQFFCSEATTLCNRGSSGTITQSSDLKGSGTQGGGSCFIKPSGKYSHHGNHVLSIQLL